MFHFDHVHGQYKTARRHQNATATSQQRDEDGFTAGYHHHFVICGPSLDGVKYELIR